jgi:hypothetical protein
VNDENECEICDPDRSNEDWSNNETICGNEGTCCARECCDEGRFCVDDACVDDTQDPPCNIGGQDYAPYTSNPSNPCEYCDPSSPSAWTVYPDRQLFVCPDNGQCCSGRCCAGGEVCQAGICTATPATTCTIGSDVYQHLEPNPLNECEICVPLVSPTGWTPAGQNTPCGTTAGRVCCSGQCCQPNQGCTANGFCP